MAPCGEHPVLCHLQPPQPLPARDFVLLATTTHSNLQMACNWLLHLRTASADAARRLVFIAEDTASADALQPVLTRRHLADARPAIKALRRAGTAPSLDVDARVARAASYNSSRFHDLMALRPWYVLRFLRLSVGVLFSDTDYVWMRDVVPHFVRNKGPDGELDFVMVNDRWMPDSTRVKFACGCLFYAAPTERSRGVASVWGNRLLSNATGATIGNQNALNFAVRHEKARRVAVSQRYFPLANRLFNKSTDAVLQPAALERAAAIHVNWVTGTLRKKARLRRVHLWRDVASLPAAHKPGKEWCPVSWRSGGGERTARATPGAMEHESQTPGWEYKVRFANSAND